MPISGFEHTPGAPDEVRFTRPEAGGERPRVVFFVQLLLLTTMALSCYSAVANLGVGMRAVLALNQARAQAASAAEHPALREVLDDPRTVERLLAARGIEVEGELAAERIEADIVRGRQLIELASFLALHAVIAFLLLSIYFPFKYLRLVNGSGSGNPAVHRAIVATARAQLLIELVRLYLLFGVWLTADFIRLHPAMVLSPVALLDVALLVFMTRPGARDFFSVYRLVPTQDPPPQQLSQGFGCMVGLAFLLGGAYLVSPAPRPAGSAARPSPAASAPAGAASPAPTPGAALGEAELAEALSQLGQGLLTLRDASGREVQFAGGDGGSLLLTAPRLSPAEEERASAAFPARLRGEFFTLECGTDPRAAAEAGLRVFREVYQLGELRLSLERVE